MANKKEYMKKYYEAHKVQYARNSKARYDRLKKDPKFLKAKRDYSKEYSRKQRALFKQLKEQKK